MESVDKPQPGYIELEAPEFLEPGQNFYDQQPFSGILQDIVSQTGTDIVILRKMLSYIRGKLKSSDPVKKEKIFNSQNLTKIMQEPARVNLLVGPKSVGIEPQEQRAVLSLMGNALEKYPLWYEYISTQFPNTVYLSDGSLNPRNLPPQRVKSYAAWAYKQLRAEHQLVTKGIEEVFPQDFAKESPIIPDIPGGPSKGRRRWVILTASELAKGK